MPLTAIDLDDKQVRIEVHQGCKFLRVLRTSEYFGYARGLLLLVRGDLSENDAALESDCNALTVRAEKHRLGLLRKRKRRDLPAARART
jgi:hypothetical protein